MEGLQWIAVWMQIGEHKTLFWLIQEMIYSQPSWMQIYVMGQIKDGQTWHCSLCPLVFC